MTQERLDELLGQVVEQAKALNIPLSGNIAPQVAVNRRATSRFGCCKTKGGAHTIELSARVLEAEERKIRQVLAHEVLHTCPGCANHGPKWKKWAEKMNQAYGYEIARTDTAENMGLKETAQAKYVLVCTKCGAHIGRSRRSALIAHPERYRCRCGGSLRPE